MTADTSAPAPATGSLAPLDAWVAANPWHPRILPFVTYIAFLLVIDQARGLSPWTYPFLYALQCAAVAFLLWRYRRFTPELTLRFHWLAIPTGLFLCWAWIELGQLTIALSPDYFAPDSDEPHYFQTMLETSPALGWSSLVLRVLGMSLLVPLFEELFTRSALLRGLHHAKPTAVGALQIVQDLPLVGDLVAETKLGQKAAALPGMFTRQLLETPLGRLSVFGVAASTLVFMFNHAMRDWLGCLACGLVWCLMLWWTNRGPAVGSRQSAVGKSDLPPSPEASPRASGVGLPGSGVSGSGFRVPGSAGSLPSPLDSRLPTLNSLGLGPIIWSHAITNAALWAYCVYTRDWQWM